MANPHTSLYNQSAITKFPIWLKRTGTKCSLSFRVAEGWTSYNPKNFRERGRVSILSKSGQASLKIVSPGLQIVPTGVLGVAHGGVAVLRPGWPKCYISFSLPILPQLGHWRFPDPNDSICQTMWSWTWVITAGQGDHGWWICYLFFSGASLPTPTPSLFLLFPSSPLPPSFPSSSSYFL